MAVPNSHQAPASAPTPPAPFTMRSWPTANSDRKPKNLAEYISRVHAQPGGFRGLSEEKIRGNIARANGVQGEGTPDASSAETGADVEMVDSGGDAVDEGDSLVAQKDPVAARMDILRDIDVAHNSAMVTLDFVSLLLSKETPVQASLTLGDALRNLVGTETLGAQKLHDSNITPARRKDAEKVATGWAVMDISKTRDAALNAAAALEKEIAKEARYWDDVLSVSNHGWSVCRLPNEPHTLGVQFGSIEAAPAFRNVSLAAMRRGDSGGVELDLGRLGSGSERLLVQIERNGAVTGRSRIDAPTPKDAPLEARVLEARNTLFAQELWHELQLESRGLLSYGVKTDGTRLTYNLDNTTKLTIELASTADHAGQTSESLPDDKIAEGARLTLHLLLSHAHSQTAILHTRPGPPNQARPRGQPQVLLRPIITHLIYTESIRRCIAYIEQLVRIMSNAWNREAAFVLKNPNSFPLDQLLNTTKSHRTNPAQTFLTSQLTAQNFQIELTITASTRLAITARTSYTTQYLVSLLDSPNPQNANLLAGTCPPFREYPTLEELKYYLRFAVASALTSHCYVALEKHEGRATHQQPHQQAGQAGIKPKKLDAPSSTPSHGTAWVKSAQGTALSSTTGVPREIRLEIIDSANGTGEPELHVHVARRKDGRTQSRKFTWNVANTGNGKDTPLGRLVIGVAGRESDAQGVGG